MAGENKPYLVLLSRSARYEFDEIVKHYLKESDTAAGWFIDEYEYYVGLIEDNPFLFSVFYSGLRRSVFRRFRYMMLYDVDEETRIVKVLTIVHTSRDPEVWKRRVS